MDKRKKAEFIIGLAVGACIVGAIAFIMLTVFWLIF